MNRIHRTDAGAHADDTGALRQTHRGNRRRLVVFLGVFVLALLAGQAWNFSRPADYRSSMRMQITLPDAGGTADTAAAALYASRLQLVNSRPVLGRLADRLKAESVPLPAAQDDAVQALQAMLDVQPMSGSEVLQVAAVGREPTLLLKVLEGLPEVVREELAGRQRGDADDRLSRARLELGRLEDKARERRAKLDQFRQQAGVVAERDDNEAVAAHKGLTTALNNAIEKEGIASARLRALTEAQAAGQVNTATRQDPALTALETKVSQVREDLREMERSFTPAFMDMDPKARAMRARLSELERQMAQQRQLSQSSALQAATEELTGAQAQVARMREKLAGVRPSLGKVSIRLADAKVLEDDLAQVEKARREVLERVARLESNLDRRVASVQVLEPAVLPTDPFRPDRRSDGVWVLGGSLLLAALAMGLVEIFNRPPPLPAAGGNTTVVVSPAWAGGPALAAPDVPLAALPSATPAAAAARPMALPSPLQLLSPAEALALLEATRGSTRLACALGLLGLSAAEALALTTDDVRPDTGTLALRGAWARTVILPPWLQAELTGLEAGRPVLCDAAGQAVEVHDLQSMLASGALDAGLPQGTSLDWDTLRATCIDWLLSQGLRYSELPALVGRVMSEQLSALAARRTDPPHRGAAEVDPLMPALRLEPSAEGW